MACFHSGSQVPGLVRVTTPEPQQHFGKKPGTAASSLSGRQAPRMLGLFPLSPRLEVGVDLWAWSSPQD